LTNVNDITTDEKVKTPLISVIVPVFNEQILLRSIIDYFTMEFKSRYQLELIISDGGSTDKTVEIAKLFADKVAIHSEARKQTIAEGRNKGAELAAGKILVFINGDTIPKEPESFFSYVYFLATDENRLDRLTALACTVKAEPKEMMFKDKLFYLIHNNYVQFLNLMGLGMGRGECQIINSNRFREVNGYNEKLIAGEDFDLFRRLAQKGKIIFVKELVVYESLRRFRKYGYIKVIWYWTINSLSVMVRGKSISKEWDAVRE
jgi:glycosyltransferase involved in cell wall biosynthesis